MPADASLPGDPVVVMAAPNGARRSPADHPALPVTPDELAGCAASLLTAGASVLHLHVRDDEGAHTLDPERYRRAMHAISSRVGDALILQATTEAVGRYTPEEQMACVRELRPEAVSIALREIAPGQPDERRAGDFFEFLARERIWPQVILYSPDEVARFDALRRRGLFACERPFCLFVFGRYADGLPGSADALPAMLGAADCDAFPWAACCFGREEQAVMLATTRAGGHVRLGFENNLELPDGRRARDNAELVADYCRAAAPIGRAPATAGDIREHWMG